MNYILFFWLFNKIFDNIFRTFLTVLIVLLSNKSIQSSAQSNDNEISEEPIVSSPGFGYYGNYYNLSADDVMLPKVWIWITINWNSFAMKWRFVYKSSQQNVNWMQKPKPIPKWSQTLPSLLCRHLLPIVSLFQVIYR